MGAEGLSVSQGHWGFPGHPAQGDGLHVDAEQQHGAAGLGWVWDRG